MFGSSGGTSFGSGNSGGFGGFGQTNTNSVFGQASTNPRTSGSFGQAQQTTPGGAFGTTTSTWGSTAPQSAFGGAPATPATNTTGVFGSTQPFGGGGSTATQPFGGGQSSTLFGSQSTAPNTTGGFGTNRSFGLQQPTTSSVGGFGQPQQQTTSPFGLASNTNTTATPFGGSQQQNQQQVGAFGLQQPATNGTGNPPYEPLKEEDSNSVAGRKGRLVYHSITSMPAFRTKCFEELRREDYVNGNKGRPSVVGGGMQTFGTQPQQAGFSGFGQQTNTQFGQQTTLFGNQQQQQNTFPTQSTFGGGTSLFGNTGGAGAAPAPSLFGTQQSAGFGFGQQQQQQKPAFGFGSSTNTFPSAPAPAPTTFGGGTSLFGNTTQQTTANSGLFGNTTTTQFGSQQPQTGGLFSFGNNNNQQQQNTASSFGQSTSSGGLFGASTTFGNTPQTGNLFGASTNTAGGGLFGNTSQQAGGFLSAPAPASAGLNFGGSTFNTSQQKPLFGATNTFGSTGGFGTSTNTGGVSLFGASSLPAPAPAPGGLFGSTTNASTTNSAWGTQGGLFGTPVGGSTSLFAPSSNFSGGTSLFNNTTQQQQQQQPVAQPNPYGYQEVQRGVLSLEKRGAELESRLRTAVGISQSDALANDKLPNNNFNNNNNIQEQQKKSLTSSGSRRSRSIGSAIFQIQASARVAPRSERGLRQVARAAALTPVSLPPPRDRVSERGRLFLESSQEKAALTDEFGQASHLGANTQEENPPSLTTSNTNDRTELPETSAPQDKSTIPETESVQPPDSEIADPSNLGDPSDEEDLPPPTNVQSAPIIPSASRPSSTPRTLNTDGFINPKAPKLTKLGYITEPPIDILETMTDVELSSVHDFAVIRSGFGKIRWLGAVDLTNVDLDRDVRICERDDTPSVEVYDDTAVAKPPHTLNLNREARIILENVGPSSTNPTQRQRALFIRRIRKSVEEIGAKLIDYNPDTRVWQFEVKSFV
mmetsp:Transcript_10253/g.15497  ORF Transcript_10253/g.15497 Transcript_10253/m.15497 type:complete len:981 (-) Transcript_10253:311-3253(-)